MKILFDTNVLVAGFIGSGSCCEIIEDAMYNHQVYYTATIINEFKNTFRNKFNFPESIIEEFAEFIRRFFREGKTIDIVQDVCRDKSDNQILADALFNKIDLIITGDNDLLVLKNYKNIKIISPKNYWVI